jgi:hypothetical protein
MLQYLIDFTNWVGQAIYNLLPLSPFQQIASPILADMQTGLGWLNWFVPFGDMAWIIGIWLVSIATFYIYKAILHWVGVSD